MNFVNNILLKLLKNKFGKILKILSLLVLLVILLRIIYENSSFNFDSLRIKQTQNGLKYKKVSLNFIDYFLSNHANVKLVDMEAELKPRDIYENMTCRSSKLIIVSTMLCLHNVYADTQVSGFIMSKGIFEEDLMSKLFLTLFLSKIRLTLAFLFSIEFKKKSL